MLTANKSAKLKQVRRTLLAIGTAGGALCFANPAMASCVIAPGGTGTVANPGPNSVVVCTGTTTGINVAGTNPGNVVQIEGGAEVNGVAGSEIRLDGSAARVVIGGGATPGPAIVRDTSITVIGDGARVDIVDGSLVDQSGNAAALIFAQGSNAFINIGTGSQVTVSRAVQLHGGGPGFLGAALYLDPTATLSASSGFAASAMIFGGTDSQVFFVEGRIEANDLNPVVTLIDAGDGNDTIALTATTRFGATPTSSSVPSFILRGGLGTDTLQFDNIHQSLVFDTIGIERLNVDGGIGGISRLRGSHEFQDITVQRGQLDVFGEPALGVPGSTLNVLADGHLRFFGTSSSVLTQQITGAGVFDYAGGSNEFATSNTFGGQFVISGGSPLISNGAAFGSATVINLASATFRDVTITNVLSGNGNYIIDGTATTLGGTNRMTGTITVQSGRLTVTDVSHLANGQVATPAAILLGAQGSLNLDLQSSGILGNAMSGTGTLNKSSAGSMTINRSNSAYSGPVNLLGGRVFISASDALGTGTIRFSGSIVDFTNTPDIVIANTITSAPGAVAVFEKNGAGRTTLTGNNSGMTAQFALNQGVIAVNSVAALGTGGNATLGGTSGIEVNNSANETLLLRISNVIPSVGTFRKLGAGRLTIGDLFQVGTLAVDVGSLRVNQTITAANATIASGARLDGTGRIISNLTNNGTIAPGNSIGTLTVQGNYIHNSGSVLEIEFDANGNIDLLAVTGTATLNGGTLRFVSLGGAEGNGGTFLTATGGVTGTFANVQTVGAQLPLAVIYQANSAIMAPSVLTARPSTFNAQFLAASDSATAFIDRIAVAGQSGPRGKRLWLQGFGSDGNRSASGTTLAYGHDGRGLAGGLILPLGERLSLGAAIGWSRSKVALGAGGGSGEQDAVLGSLHLRYAGPGFALEGGAIYGSVDQQMVRNVSFNGFSASVNGATGSKLYGGFVGAEAELARIDGWRVAASARASLIHQAQDGFTEGGTSPLRLAVPKLDNDTLEAQGGLGVKRAIGAGELRFDLGARLIDNLGDRTFPVTFAASAAGVTLQGDARSSVHGYAGAALDLPLSQNVFLTLGYAGQIGQTDRHEGRVGLQVSF